MKATSLVFAALLSTAPALAGITKGQTIACSDVRAWIAVKEAPDKDEANNLRTVFLTKNICRGVPAGSEVRLIEKGENYDSYFITDVSTPDQLVWWIPKGWVKVQE